MDFESSLWTRTPSELRAIHWELEDTWKDNARLIPSFFQLDQVSRRQSRSAKAEWYLQKSSRWSRVPRDVQPGSLPVLRLRKALVDVLNGILHHFDRTSKREFVDTSSVDLHPRHPLTTSPSILLVRRVDGQSEPTYRYGLCCFEVIREHTSKLNMVRKRLAVHATELFACQGSRRFAFGLLMTEKILETYMFDRAGVVRSETLDYHKNWAAFCAIIAGISTTEEALLGFDPSIFTKDGVTCIRTTESPEPYVVQQRLYHASNLTGRGTVCWLVHRAGEDDNLVIKDAWIHRSSEKGKTSEAAILRYIRKKGITEGVPHLKHVEQVKIGLEDDTVLNNRRLHLPPREASLTERNHTRLVLSGYGKPIQCFSSRLELVAAFHDIVQVHCDLFFKAGVLHRDVSMNNLLINPNGKVGERGLLIDFDQAIRVEHVLRNVPRKVGTAPFMSRNMLDPVEPHSHRDDLESFYYVLCFIVTGYTGPGIDQTHKKPLPAEFDYWNGKMEDDIVAQDKSYHFTRAFQAPIDPWFGPHITDLVKALHKFFTKRTWEGLRQFLDKPHGPEDDPNWKTWKPKPLSPLDPVEDYRKFLGCIRTALTALQAESDQSLLDTQLPAIGTHLQDQHTQKRQRETETSALDGRISGAKRPKNKDAPQPPARPRRSKAKYAINVRDI